MADDDFMGLEALTLPLTHEQMEAYWRTYREVGPLHHAAWRMMRLRGWTIEPGALHRFLEPELPEVTRYG